MSWYVVAVIILALSLVFDLGAVVVRDVRPAWCPDHQPIPDKGMD